VLVTWVKQIGQLEYAAAISDPHVLVTWVKQIGQQEHAAAIIDPHMTSTWGTHAESGSVPQSLTPRGLK
jgi:hypothetical protein